MKSPSRDQGRMGGFTRFGSALVVRSSPPLVLDVDAGTAKPVEVPGLTTVFSVGGDSVPVAAGLRDGGVVIRRQREGVWADLALPAALVGLRGTMSVSVSASGDRVAATWWSSDATTKPPTYAAGLTVFDGAKWRDVVVPETPAGKLPMHAVWAHTRWLFGYARGEWGGSLWELDSTGVLKRVGPPQDLPVNAIVPLADGRVLVGQGLAHLGGLNAEVGLLDAKGAWSVVARADGYEPKKNVAWPLAADSVEGVAVDASGAMFALTGGQGVVRLSASGASKVIPGWPTEHLYGNGLMVEGEHFVIGTFDSGVLVWTPSTKLLRRIPIPR